MRLRQKSCCGGAVLCVLMMFIAVPVEAQFRVVRIATCIGSFGSAGPGGPCTLQASSSGPLVTSTETINTSGDTITYTASGFSSAGSLGGIVSVESNTFDAGPGIMVDAQEQLVDVLTISSPTLNGSIGNLAFFYTIHGTNSKTGNNLSGGCVKIGINVPIFPGNCTQYLQPSVTETVGSATYPFTYGPLLFPLWFQLESFAGTGFGPDRALGFGSSTSDFANTATITGVLFYDQNMNPLNITPTITSALHISYPVGLPVTINIKPGDTPSINLKSHGKIPLAILSTDTFNALTVDTSTLTFGHTGTEQSLGFCNQKDVDSDGLFDLICLFETQLAGFQRGDTVGILRGSTTVGVPIQARATIITVP